MSGAGHEPCIPGGPYSPSRETFKKPLLTAFSAEERLLLVRCADHLLSDFRSHVCDTEGFALMPPENLIAEAITTQQETADMMNSVSSIDDWYEDDALLKEILGAEKTIQHIAFAMAHVLLNRVVEWGSECVSATALGGLFGHNDLW